MARDAFKKLLEDEVQRIDNAKTAKRHERVITGFTEDHKATIAGAEYTLFNSNDYLGLRFNTDVLAKEHAASERYGTGPGAVRFISGSMEVYGELEKAIAAFHERDDAMVFSSAFATNMGVLHAMIKGQSKDSLVGKDTLVVSDALNHRSIIDGIRIAGLDKTNKAIFAHLNIDDLDRILEEHAGKFTRVIVVSDGIFSMLGEYQDIGKLQAVADKYDDAYAEGVVTIVDDAHGVACFGKTGRGVEEHTGGRCTVLVGTLGKGFGADGGYVTGDQAYIDYLRESAATYIYSNPFSPGTAGAARAAVGIVDSAAGATLLEKLNANISLFKEKMQHAGFTFAADSSHPIQPILIGDATKTDLLVQTLFKNGIVVTGISYPVVPKGSDEIRAQLSALHTEKDIVHFVTVCSAAARELGIV